MKYYGIRGIPLEWFRSYLQNRKQYVSVNGHSSPIQSINIGVPQGSVLGPLLFILYINDLQFSSNVLDSILYADDSNLFISGKNITNTCAILNNELDKVNQWFLANKLKLNVDKTSCMIFKTKNKQVDLSDINIHMAGINIPIVQKTKFLGVILDDNLSWKYHIDEVCCKISKSIGVINRISAIVPSKILLSLYSTMILPHIMYCNIIWGNSAKYLLNRIHILQKRAIRIITNSLPLTHSDPLFKKCKLLNIYDINKFVTSTFMYSYVNNILPKFLENCFVDNKSKTNCSTRQCDNLFIPNYKYDISRCTVKYAGPTLWNALPANFKSINSLSTFKKKYKLHLLNQ